MMSAPRRPRVVIFRACAIGFDSDFAAMGASADRIVSGTCLIEPACCDRALACACMHIYIEECSSNGAEQGRAAWYVQDASYS